MLNRKAKNELDKIISGIALMGMMYIYLYAWPFLIKISTWYKGLSSQQYILLYSTIIVLFAIIVYKKKKSDIKSGNTHSKNNEIIEINNINIENEYKVMQQLRSMYPKYFEEFIELLFVLSGYTITKSPSYNGRDPMKDGGIDLIVEKDEQQIYIQIKKDFSHQTGVSIVRELNGCILNEGGRRIVISSSVFSKDAIEFAQLSGIELIDYHKLLLIISEIAKNHKNELELYINNEKYRDHNFAIKPITCKYCYAPMQKRKGGFYGCLNFYTTGCKYTESLPMTEVYNYHRHKYHSRYKGSY